MATTYKSAACAASIQPKDVVQGLISKTGSYALTSTENVATNILQMVKVPNGATVLDVLLYSPDLDTGSPALDISVGDGDTADLYISAETTVGGTAGTRRGGAFVPKKYAKDDTIDITINTASTTHANGTIYLTVLYTMDA